MVQSELFAYKDSDKALRQKGLLQEIKDIFRSIKEVDHKEIQSDFQKKVGTLRNKYSLKRLKLGMHTKTSARYYVMN